MHDEDTQANLQAYLDGQLPPVKAQAIRAHLEACEACQAELNALRQVDEALATMPVVPEPPELKARIMAQVAAPAFRLRWEDAAVSAALACAAAATLLVLVLVWPQDSALPGAYLQKVWWTWVPWLDRLWHTLRLNPVHIAGALSGLCLAAAAAIVAATLAQRTIRARSASSLRPRRS